MTKNRRMEDVDKVKLYKWMENHTTVLEGLNNAARVRVCELGCGLPYASLKTVRRFSANLGLAVGTTRAPSKEIENLQKQINVLTFAVRDLSLDIGHPIHPGVEAIINGVVPSPAPCPPPGGDLK